MKKARPEELADLPVEERTRLATLALGSNLKHIRWREVNHYGNPASVGMQLAMTLVFWLASCSLEEAMSALDGDPLTPKSKRQWAEPDFQADEPEGLRFNLPKWREALSRGQVAPMLADGRQVVGLRAWLDDTGGGSPVWEMSLSRERLEVVVDTLSRALIFWESPITLPPPDEESPLPSGERSKGRKASQDEP